LHHEDVGVPQTRRGDRGRLKFSKQPLRITPRARRQVWELSSDAVIRMRPERRVVPRLAGSSGRNGPVPRLPTDAHLMLTLGNPLTSVPIC
jgi:hypothetical protein